jgi:hypothetical protein
VPRIEYSLSRIQRGHEDRGRVGKYIYEASRGVGDELKAAGWTIVSNKVEHGAIHVVAEIGIDEARRSIRGTAEKLDAISRNVQLE